MSKLHLLDYDGLRTVDAAMNADRARRACREFTQYEVDTTSGDVRQLDEPKHNAYRAQHKQETPLGTYFHGCTCPDVACHIENLNRQLMKHARAAGTEARERAGLPHDSTSVGAEAQDMGARCQCKHHHMRRLAQGLPVFVYLGTERWRVTLTAGGKPFYRKSFIGKA